MLDDYLKKLKPKVVIFLTGVNDIENEGPSFFDKLTRKNAYPDLLHFLYNNSEVINAAVNLSRSRRARKLNNTTQEMKVPGTLGELKMTREEVTAKMSKQEKFLQGYESRIAALIDTCMQNDILPVFITQPCLYGEGVDSVTGVNLATSKVEEGMNGKLLSDLIGRYNDRMTKTCEKKLVPCINLNQLMPKNSLYYYDQTHYTNEGAAMVAMLIAEEMKIIIAGTY
jgi:hypothetical protein